MSTRRFLGATALAAVTSLTLIAGTAQAIGAPPSSITAKADDSTPRSGQTFHVSGLFTAQGKPADHLVVKMQILNGDSWAQLTGAKMRTLSNGAYTMRVILQAKGERTLRAVGVDPGPARDAFKRFEVTVH
jgi:hypothetical protein